jgi:hypothetical protein
MTPQAPTAKRRMPFSRCVYGVVLEHTGRHAIKYELAATATRPLHDVPRPLLRWSTTQFVKPSPKPKPPVTVLANRDR